MFKGFEGSVQIPDSLLSPNLHCAVCRLPRQEKSRGNAARELELWMERWMLIIKARSKYKTIQHVEKSFIKNTEATERSLLRNRVVHGCKPLHTPPVLGIDDSLSVHVRGAGKRVTPRLQSPIHGLTREGAVQLARTALAVSSKSSDTTDVALLDEVQIKIHKSAMVHGFKFDSRHAMLAHRAVNSRSYQNSFVRVLAADLVPLIGLFQGSTMHPPTNTLPHPIRGSVYAQIEFYFDANVPPLPSTAETNPVRALSHGAQLLPVDDNRHPSRGVHMHTAVEPGSLGMYAVVQPLRDAVAQTFAGTPTVVTCEPLTDVPLSGLYCVPISCFKAQVLVLKSRHERGQLRFLECPGKLLLV